MPLLHDASMRTLWAWWWPSITAWLPDSCRYRFVPESRVHVLNWTGCAVDLAVMPSENVADTLLLVPQKHALVRVLQLPASAASRLRDIAHFEIDRQTPFSPEQVYFDAVPTPPVRRGHGTLTATLIVVPRRLLDEAIEAISANPIRLIAVDVEDANGGRLGANLLPTALRYRPPERWRRWNFALAGMCVVASFGLAISLLHARQRGIATLEQQATAVLAQAADVQRRAAALSEMRRISRPGGQAALPSVLVLLSGLSAALPLDSHFIHIELGEEEIRARGQTEDLAGVLAGLRDSRLWADPELTGSRTLPDGHRQEFSLRLRLRKQQAKPAP